MDCKDTQNDARYLSELNIDLFPLDVFVSTDCIEMVTQALLPFVNLITKSLGMTEETCQESTSVGDSLAQLNNNTLPLVYLKAKSFRLFLFNSHQDNLAEDVSNKCIPDLFLIELESANLTSQVDNPINRILVDHKMYYKSAEAGTLEVPGAYIEDRQYQLNLQAFSIYTANLKVILKEL